MSENSSNTIKFCAELKGGDFLEIEKSENGKMSLRAVACSALSRLLEDFKLRYQAVENWPLPKGDSHEEILLREVLLKAKGLWSYPTTELEVCHCRAVSTETVDQAIICGALTPDIVSRWTSASTACGTCRGLVEKMIQFRKSPEF